MRDPRSREALIRTIALARRRLFVQALLSGVGRVGLVAIPLGAIAVAADQRWGAGEAGRYVALGVAVACVGLPLFWAFLQRRSILGSAAAIDGRASLKDRIASAWQFVNDPSDLNEPRLTQIHDALRHAQAINVRSMFRPHFSRAWLLLPVALAVFAACYFVPAKVNPQVAEAAFDARRQAQSRELQTAHDELMRTVAEDKELNEVLRTLKEIQRRFEQGDLSERDVMIELSRLDEQLRKSAEQPGVENLQRELNQIVPHLMAGDASRQVAMAVKEQRLDDAAKEMEKLAEKEKTQQLSKEEKDKLAMNLGVAASKLGSKDRGSFGGDFSSASESLKSGDSTGFSESAKSISQKMSSVAKFQKLTQARNRLSFCKSSLAQFKVCKECNGKGEGCSACNGSGLGTSGADGKGTGKGGLKAGVGAQNPLGEANRLAYSYRKMLEVRGQAGAGEVESEVELTEGQTSESRLEAKDVYSEYAAVAEEAIEREEIPLSHRLHVKRYFQAIRPQE